MPVILRFLTILLILISACAPLPDREGDTNFSTGTHGINAPWQRDKPYLVMISIDGFRWDYLDNFATPEMNRLAAQGVRAERLIPVFPTLTFPNHYSLATGLYPANHGIVANDFPIGEDGYWYHLRDRESVQDGRNYRGEPIWVTAETQGMVAAAFFWVGTEADIQGIHPTHWRKYDKGVAGTDRVDQILEWLAQAPANRPHLYNLYFEDVDDNAHWYGPNSLENGESAERVDGYIKRLTDGLKKLPHGDQVNIVLVSDHGQAAYLENQNEQVLNELVDLSGIQSVDGGCYLFLHFDQADQQRAIQIRDTVNRSWENGHAYLKEDTPVEWHVNDDPRFPDVIIEGISGHAVLSRAEKGEGIHPGDHGWPPESADMHGFFVAHGPAFKQGLSIGPVRNVDVYPLMLSVLSLEAPEQIDGNAQALSGVLK